MSLASELNKAIENKKKSGYRFSSRITAKIREDFRQVSSDRILAVIQSKSTPSLTLLFNTKQALCYYYSC